MNESKHQTSKKQPQESMTMLGVLGTEMSISDTPTEIKNVKCPQCGKGFILRMCDCCGPQTIMIAEDDNGDILQTGIVCPHCRYFEEL